jgi:hypothetical protein
MATTRVKPLNASVHGGVDMTSPSHLVLPPVWRRAHNMRFTPSLEQVPRKIVHSTIGDEEIRGFGVLPGSVNGYGKILVFGERSVHLMTGTALKENLRSEAGKYHRWSMTLYNGALYYINEMNALRRNNGSTDVAVSAEAPAGRYVTSWYDHMVVGAPVGNVNRVQFSDLYDFSKWTPTPTNEADHYDFVEWQQTDYPWVGVTGLAKLRNILYVYTPTAIIPMQYVGLPKVIQVMDSGIVTHIGNTHPWALVPLDNVHFFYDGIEQNFFAFDGQQTIPIGDPIRKYVQETLSTNLSLASKMWGYVDVEKREVWWLYCSSASSGELDQAVVFNYRQKIWFTASVENVHAFCGTTFSNTTVGDLDGIVQDLPGIVGELGAATVATGRLFGSGAGKILREEKTSDATSALLPQDDPVLETGDFHYGDIVTRKEVDGMCVNAAWDEPQNPSMALEVRVHARDYLDNEVKWTEEESRAGDWDAHLPHGQLTFKAKAGRILRYRFRGKNARGLKFSAFSESIYAQKAEK